MAMHTNYHFEETFFQHNFTEYQNVIGDYENCKFISCDLNTLVLSDVKFINCEFIECNLSNSKLINTSFQQVEFKNCKMIGFNLEICNQFGLNVFFERCILNDSTFYQLPLQKSKFIECSLQNVDFSYTDLSHSYFNNCDCLNAIFDQTNLKQANLKTSYNFRINPNENQLKGAVFSKENIIGLVQHLGLKIE
ncbi:pentapeptide repeat-containing protein [Empedobacter falsenii]